MTLVAIFVSQLFFTCGDLMARHFLRKDGFHLASFIAWWFVAYVSLRTVATFGQLFVLSQLEVGKTMAIFSASSLVLVNVLGVLLLSEVLSVQVYIGIAFAVLAILIIGISR